MTNTLIKIIINKHSKYFACLAQSVEHSAVNRSVGGPSPSTGAKKNVKTFFFLCLFWRLVPLPHDCAAALCAPTLLPNWTLDETNKFVICATSRGSVLTPKKPKACENVLFFVPVLGSYPCHTIVRRHFVPRHFFSGSPQKDCFCGVIVWTRCVVVNKFTHNATSRGPQSRIALKNCGATLGAQ